MVDEPGRQAVVIAYNTSWYVWNFRMPLISALREKGFRVVVLAPRDEYTQRIVGAGVDFRELRLDARGKNPLREVRAVAGFFAALRELTPACLLLYTIKPNLYGGLAARLLRVPAIANVTGLGAVFETRGLLQVAVRLLYRTAFARVCQVFFQNPDDLALFTESGLVRRAQADLLPGSGVDLTRFSPRPRGEGPFTFLFVGRLLRAKGVDDLAEAARIVAESVKGIRIVLLGRRDDDDPESANPGLLDRALREGLVEVPGNVDDVRPFIARADCVVLPSYYREGTPRSLLEAAAMARPLIAADSVGTREPVRHGENGFLCRPRDPADLASRMIAMIGLTAQERERMGIASRRIAEDRYDERIVIRKYLDAVDRLTAGAR